MIAIIDEHWDVTISVELPTIAVIYPRKDDPKRYQSYVYSLGYKDVMGLRPIIQELI